MKVNVKAKQSITLFTSHWLPQNLFSRFRPIEIWTNLQYEENWMHWIFYWQQCRSPFFESWRLVFCHLRQLFLGLFEFLWWLLVPRLGVRHDYVIGQAGAKYMSCCYECCLCIFANLNVSLSSYFTLFIREKHLDICRWIKYHGFPEQFSALLSKHVNICPPGLLFPSGRICQNSMWRSLPLDFSTSVFQLFICVGCTELQRLRNKVLSDMGKRLTETWYPNWWTAVSGGI